MADFLGTTATNFRLEELIKKARGRLILISPYLNVNERIKELLIDKDRLKIDMRVVYGKSELQPQEIAWMKGLSYLRTSFCQHLHAKCYLSEEAAIITSMNLYEFSQINNNEMGVFITRAQDAKLYGDVLEESLRIVRISEEVRLSAEKVTTESNSDEIKKYTTSKLASRVGLKAGEFEKLLLRSGYLEKKDGKNVLSTMGEDFGGESKFTPRKKGGTYFLWPEDILDRLEAVK